MILDLEKSDLINLLMGTSPNYDVMEDPTIKPYGDYTGGFVDKWSWNKFSLVDLEDETLFDMYLTCKNSWK